MEVWKYGRMEVWKYYSLFHLNDVSIIRISIEIGLFQPIKGNGLDGQPVGTSRVINKKNHNPGNSNCDCDFENKISDH